MKRRERENGHSTCLRLSETAAGTILALGAVTTSARRAPYRTVQYGALIQSTDTSASSPAQSGWTWVLTIAVALAFLAVWWVLFRRQAKRFQQTYLLEIANLGNIQSQYVLQANDPARALRFTFLLGGHPLSGQPVARPDQATAQPTRTETATRARPPSPELRAGVDTLKSARGKGMRTGSSIANALDSLGGLLPHSVGAPVRRAAAQIRRGQRSVRRVEQLPGKATQISSRAVPGRVSARPQPAAPFRQEPVPRAAAIQTIEQEWVETPFVEPGETLVVDLSIDPKDPYQTRTYPFVVESWSLEQPEDSLIVEENSVQIVEPTFLQRYSPFLITAIIAAVVWLLARAVIGTGF